MDAYYGDIPRKPRRCWYVVVCGIDRETAADVAWECDGMGSAEMTWRQAVAYAKSSKARTVSFGTRLAVRLVKVEAGSDSGEIVRERLS